MEKFQPGVLVIVVALVVGVVQSRSPPMTKCDMLYDAVIRFRDNVLRNPVALESFEGTVDSLETEMARYLKLTSLDDSDEIRKVACKIAGFQTAQELASEFGVDAQNVRFFFQAIKGVYAELEELQKLKDEVVILHPWLKKSGFPDTWPLNTNAHEVRLLLKETPTAMSQIVLMGGDRNKDTDEIVKIVTESTSLQQYANALGVEDWELGQALMNARILADENKLEQALHAFDSYVYTLTSIKMSGILDLP